MICTLIALDWDEFTLAAEPVDTLVVSKATQAKFDQIEEYVNFKEEINQKYQLCCRRSKFKRIPRKINELFSYLTHLRMENCSLTKISSDDLQNLCNLKVLLLNDNNLSTLPGDLFKNTIKLRVISFENNQLTWVGSNLLDCLTQLEVVDFIRNPIINAIGGRAVLLERSLGSTYITMTIVELRRTIKNGFEQETVSKILQEEEVLPIPTRILDIASLKDFSIDINGERIEVHRIVLATFSPVFLKMFEDNPSARSLQLVDCSAEIFRIILDFMYRGKFPDDNIDMIGLFSAAGKLEILPLLHLAQQKLMSIIVPTNAYEILLLANKYNSTSLKVKAFDVTKQMLPGKQIKDEWMDKPEKMRKLLEAKRKMDEIVKKAEKEFEALQLSDDEKLMVD